MKKEIKLKSHTEINTLHRILTSMSLKLGLMGLQHWKQIKGWFLLVHLLCFVLQDTPERTNSRRASGRLWSVYNSTHTDDYICCLSCWVWYFKHYKPNNLLIEDVLYATSVSFMICSNAGFYWIFNKTPGLLVSLKGLEQNLTKSWLSMLHPNM